MAVGSRASASCALAAGCIALVQLYRMTLSAWLGGRCRFYPSCSAYALGALRCRPLHVALAQIVWRLLRCNPFCRGGLDWPCGPPTGADRAAHA